MDLRTTKVEPGLSDRLVLAANARGETVEQCVAVMLKRGLDLEDVFGPLGLGDEIVGVTCSEFLAEEEMVADFYDGVGSRGEG
jgi:hypothetical protein